MWDRGSYSKQFIPKTAVLLSYVLLVSKIADVSAPNFFLTVVAVTAESRTSAVSDANRQTRNGKYMRFGRSDGEDLASPADDITQDRSATL